MKILVSSCLLAIPCRWHGKKTCYSSFVKKHLIANPQHIIVEACPEVLGGLPVPRPAVKRLKGRVFETCAEKANRKNVTGKDVTAFFVSGAEESLAIAIRENIKLAILCKWSPSCDASGITGKLLISHGIEVINTW